MELTDDVMYRACMEKDTSFEGLFFTAVKTTGIFCRPSCTARKPLRKNVEFFKTSREAITSGYRPCKICKPLEKLNATPEGIKTLLAALSDDPSVKYKDYDLVQRGLDPVAVRRWFVKNHDMTFHAYQRMFRINSAFKKIKKGSSVTDAAYQTGYDSLSGFGDSFKNIFGVSPSKGKEQRVIDLKRIETPLGTMFACAVEEGLCLLEFSDRKMLETAFKYIAKRLNSSIVQGDNPHFELLEKELDAYFKGILTEFTVPMYWVGTDFQKSVWQMLMTIPYGSTRSYKEQAIAIGNPKAIRAVANANGMNHISIIVPCHRVIGSDGSLTGYGGGLWRKQFLLDLERKEKQQSLF